MHGFRPRPRYAASAAALVLTLIFPSPADAESSGFPDLPHPELMLNEGLPEVGAHDAKSELFGLPDGRVCSLILENFDLRSFPSSDAGATFGPGVLVAGPAGPSAVHNFEAVLAPDDRLYVAMMATDPAGGWRVLATRSDDLGATWTSPSVVVESPGPVPIDNELRIDATATVVAISYVRWVTGEVWVAVSDDRAGSWILNRVDAGEGEAAASDVAIEPSTGYVHVVFSAAATGSSADWEPWTARSTDGGMTFEAPVNRAALIPAGTSTTFVEAVIATDESLLVAVPYTGLSVVPDGLRIVRSTDHGATFTQSLERTFTGVYGPVLTRFWIVPSEQSATVLVAFVAESAMVAYRSTNHGASFGAEQVLSSAGAIHGFLDRCPVTRTSAGNWAYIWEYAQAGGLTPHDLQVRISTNDGLTWNPTLQVNTPPYGAYSTRDPSVAAAGPDEVVVGWLDTRESGGTTADVFANSATASSGAFGADRPLDDDGTTIPVPVSDGLSTTADGDRHVHVAFCTAAGADLVVRSSADKGRTFSAPTVVESGSSRKTVMAAASTSDGHVSVVFEQESITESPTLRIVRSEDHGGAWSPAMVIGGEPLGSDASISAVPGGRTYVAWFEAGTAYLARLDAQDSSIDTLDFGQGTSTNDRYPEVCADGDQVVVVWSARRSSNATTLFANVSTDGGDTFGTRVDLRPGGASQFVRPSLACDGNGNALVTWIETRNGSPYQIRSSRFHEGQWSTEEPIAAQPAVNVYNDSLTFVDAAGNVAIIVYQGYEPEAGVYVSRSTDGGVNFDSYQRLDLAAPDPSAADYYPKGVSDRDGRVWVTWNSATSGAPHTTVVVTKSTDGGQTFSAVRRVGRAEPPDSMRDWYSSNWENLVAVPGVGLITWLGQRNSRMSDALLNRDVHDEDLDGSSVDEDCDDLSPVVLPGAPQLCDGLNNDCLDASWPTPPADEVTDGDADGRIDCADCAPADPTAQDPPQEVEAVGWPVGGATLVWAAAGDGVRFDLAGGSISDLRLDAGPAVAVCLADDLTVAEWEDLRADPPVNEGYYYLVRTENACGTGTFGTDSAGNERIPTLSCP